MLDSKVPEQLTQLTQKLKSSLWFKSLNFEKLSAQVRSYADEQELSQAIGSISGAIKRLQASLEREIVTAQMNQVGNALDQWREELRVTEAILKGQPGQAMVALEQSTSQATFRPQMKALVKVLRDQQEHEHIAISIEKITGKLQRLERHQYKGMSQLAEAIAEQRARDQVAHAVHHIKERLGRQERYPGMARLAQSIRDLGEQNVLELTPQLNALAAKLERLNPESTPRLSGLRELAATLQNHRQDAAIAEQMEQVEGLQVKVSGWIQSLPEIQRSADVVKALREQPGLAKGAVGEQLTVLAQELRGMKQNVTPKPKPKKAAAVESQASYEQKVEWLRPAHISKESWKELVIDSHIKPSVAEQYFMTLDGAQAREYLLSHALGQVGGHGQQFATSEVANFLSRYEHLEAGGLWCKGVPVEGEMWGQLKPETPFKEWKDAKRFQVKLKTGKVIHLPMPEGYEKVYKVRKYEAIPKGPGKDAQSMLSHYAFTNDLERLRRDTSIRIVHTEGAKKGAAIHSQGEASLALNGVRGGYQVLDSGARVLAEHLEAYDWQGRASLLWFDKDPADKEKTQRDVSIALYRYGKLLERAGSVVEVAQMPGRNDIKMGADDFLAKGNTIDDLQIMTLEQWIEHNPYVQEHLQAVERQRYELSLDKEEEMER